MLGWTAEQTLKTPVPLIELAVEGRYDVINSVLKAVFPPKKSPREASPALQLAQFKIAAMQHNAALGKPEKPTENP